MLNLSHRVVTKIQSNEIISMKVFCKLEISFHLQDSIIVGQRDQNLLLGTVYVRDF